MELLQSKHTSKYFQTFVPLQVALARQLTPGLILFWMIDPRSFDPFPVFSFIPARQTLLIAEQSYGCWRLYFSYFGLSFTFPQFSGFEFSDARVSLL